METLSNTQLEELKKRAVNAIKIGDLHFFEQSGLKNNFPWLREEVARQQVSAARQENWDLGLMYGYGFATLGFEISVGLNGIDIFSLGVVTAGMIGGFIAGIRMITATNFVKKAYCESVERAKIGQLNVLISKDGWLISGFGSL